MKREAFRRGLSEAYAPIPEDTHQALLSTVAHLGEEPVMKKKLTWIPALILALALLGGTALALINHFSVRDYHSYLDPSVRLEENITTINQAYENEHLEIHFGDAVFDGRNLTVAMNLTPKHPEERVYLYPVLTGELGGKPLVVQLFGGVAGFDQGLLYPARGGEEMIWNDYGFEAMGYLEEDEAKDDYMFLPTLLEDTGDGPVRWTLRILTMTTDWPILYDDDPELMADYALSPLGEDRMQLAYAQGFIIATGVGDIHQFADALPPPEGYDEEAWSNLGYNERLLESGVFTLSDTVDCVFETEIPKDNRTGIAAGMEFSMDGHTVVVDAINSSFFLLDYRFHIDLAAGEEAGPLLASMMAWQNEGYFDAFTADGEPYGQPYSYMQWPVEHEDGSRSIHFAVEVYPEAALPESLTFVPYTRQGFGYEKEYHEDAAFTIPLE